MNDIKLQMHSPPHPGEILKELYIVPLDITLTYFAECLGVRRATISAIVNGRSSISSEMAMRLSKALNTTPDLWLGLQLEYDLWQVKQEFKENKSIKDVKSLIA